MKISYSLDSRLYLDFSECKEGLGDSGYHGFGSTSIKVVKPGKDTCGVSYVNEVEGGWSEYYCEVPRNVGEFTGFEQINRYCTLRKSGNLLSGSERQYITIPYIGTFTTQGVLTFIGIIVLIAVLLIVIITAFRVKGERMKSR